MTGRPPTGIRAVQEMFESASNPSGTRPAAGMRTVISSGRRISWAIGKCRQPHARPIGRGGLCTWKSYSMKAVKQPGFAVRDGAPAAEKSAQIAPGEESPRSVRPFVTFKLAQDALQPALLGLRIQTGVRRQEWSGRRRPRNVGTRGLITELPVQCIFGCDRLTRH